MKLYMFQTVLLSIIRSLFTVHSAMVYAIQVCRQLASRTRTVLLEILSLKKLQACCRCLPVMSVCSILAEVLIAEASVSFPHCVRYW